MEASLLEQSQDTEEIEEIKIEENAGLNKALDTYRKLIEKEELTEKQQEELEKKIVEIERQRNCGESCRA